MDDDAAQDTDRLIASALQAIGERPEYSGPVAVGKIRTAMCLPVTPHIGLFPDAWSLLAEIREADVRCVLVTNAVWRDTAAYWHDLESLGVAHAVDAVVSSVDVGFRKPHPAIFAAAVAASGCAPTACVMIGNSERADIQPALRLGMHTIRVAIEEPLPASSTAHLLTDSLLSAAAQVRAWRTQPTQPSQTG